jgi:S-adenosylmethionine hydrolase
VTFAANGVVTLTSDFGWRDAYVGAIKGTIVSSAPDVRIHDLAHEIEPQNIWQGATVLRGACPLFPAGTIHLAVVDPGVGTTRAPIVLLAGRHAFVGPDNGIFSLVAEALGGIETAYRIEPAGPLAFLLPRDPCPTFQGRDVFAPVVAALASGRITPADLGPLHEPLPLISPVGVVNLSAGAVEGRVTQHDRFGNAITNIRARDLRALPSTALMARLGDDRSVVVARTYGDVPKGEPLALIGSEGFLEIAVREGSARERLGLSLGATVRIEPSTRAA